MNDSIRNKVGSALKKIREDKNLSIEQLSEKSGMSVRAISGIEEGKFSAHLDQLEKIAAAMDYTIGVVGKATEGC